MNKIRLALALAVAAVLSSAGWAAAPLADKMPEGAKVYVGWAGRTLPFEGSRFGKLLQTAQVAQFFEAAKAALLGSAGQEADQATAGHFWAMAAIAWQRPVAAGVFDLVMPPPPAAADEGPPARRQPELRAAVLIDLQKDQPAFATHLQAVLAAFADRLKIEKAAVGSVSYQTFATPAGPCGVGFVGGVFFLTVGQGAAETVVALLGGKGKALAGEPKFDAAMKEVCGESVQLAYYVDVAAVLATVQKFVPAPPAEGENAPENIVAKVAKAVGVAKVTALAGASNIVDRGFYEKTRILSPAPHEGLLMLLAGKPLPATALAGAPADSLCAAAINIDPAQVLTEVKRIAAAVEPRAARDIDRGLAEANKRLGLDIEKDLLAHVGDQWTLVSAPSLGGFLTGTVATVDLKDPEKFAAALAKLEAALTGPARPGGEGARPAPPNVSFFGALTSPAGPLAAGALGMVGKKPAIKVTTVGKTEIHYVMVEGLPFPVAPAWAVHGKRLYVAAFPQVITAAITGTAEPPLADQPAFAALRKRVSPSASALLYVNTHALLRQLYGLPLLGWTALGNVAPPPVRPMFRPDILPPLPELEQYFQIDISAISSDAKGITYESYGSLPGGGLIGASPGRILPALAVALPVYTIGRQRGRSTVSMHNLHMIGRGIGMYRADHNGQLPPDLVSLVEKKYIPAQVLFSPSGGGKVQLDAGGKPVGPFDYVYLGAQFGADPPPDLMVVHERLELSLDGHAVALFMDHSVSRMPMARFREHLRETQDYLKKKTAAGK